MEYLIPIGVILLVIAFTITGLYDLLIYIKAPTTVTWAVPLTVLMILVVFLMYAGYQYLFKKNK